MIDLFKKKSNKDNIISEDYYKLLTSVSVEVQEVIRKIKKNNDIVDILKSVATTNNMSLDMMLNTFFIHDIIQTLKKINNDSSTDYAQYAGCQFFIHLITNHNLIAYKHLVALTKDPKLFPNVIIPNIKNISNNELKIKIEYDGNICKNKYNFVLPAFLKSTENSLFDNYISCLYHCANVLAKSDGIVSQSEVEALEELYKLLQDPLEFDMGDILKNNNKNHVKIKKGTNESIESILEELNTLVGLDNIKKEINTLINFIKIQEARKNAGLETTNISYHIVFTGNPGTGKTTVARIIAKIYKELGILTEGQLVETDRSGLIGQYVGHTANKVNSVVDSAINGVLFIDEAYSLVEGSENDYGKEALAALIKRMEDDRDKLIVICAGYTNEMKKFIETNPGLKSRFNRYLDFSDYSALELLSIYKMRCSQLDYCLTQEAEVRLTSTIQNASKNKDKTFGNARYIRNLFEKTLENQANRIASIGNLSKEVLTTITEDDIPLM